MEVDLHIERLLDSIKGMSNFDILNYQINSAQKQLEFALRKRIKCIVFIHGVGEGVLKMEVETLLRRYDYIKFHQADPRQYGMGAIEAIIDYS
jgi:DNA-nicking Smr family endonuclease